MSYNVALLIISGVAVTFPQLVNRKKLFEASYPRPMVFEACQTVIFPLYGISASCVTTGFSRPSSARWCWARQANKTDAHLDKTYWESVCQAPSRTAHVHLTLLLITNASCCFVLLLLCWEITESWQSTVITEKYPSCAEQLDQRVSAEQGVAACYWPLYLLDHVKTPNKETDAPLLLNRCRCYVVVVSVISHLNALCWSGGGVAFPLEGFCYSTLLRMLLERVGSCCRDLSCLTLEGLLTFFALQSKLSPVQLWIDFQCLDPKYYKKAIAIAAWKHPSGLFSTMIMLFRAIWDEEISGKTIHA